MVVSAMPVEQLKAVAAKDGVENLNLRFQAILVMARQGGTDLIPFLESLRASPDDYSRADFNERRRSLLDYAIRQIRIRQGRRAGAPK